MNLRTEAYRKQIARWPQCGRHILAQFDDDAIVVYQAYKPTIGNFAAKHGYFGGGFSLSRMSWIKTNFLWMMYRSGWGTKPDQETTLAIWLRRSAFDELLQQAVHSTYVPEIYGTREAWSQVVANSSVRLQWDPDHDPAGNKLERRAIQLGLRDDALKRYATKWIVRIEDISSFVAEQRLNAQSEARYELLITPEEDIYPVSNSLVASKLELTQA